MEGFQAVAVVAVVVAGRDMSEDSAILHLNRPRLHVQHWVRKIVAVSLARTCLQSEMRMTVRLAPAGTRHLHRHHRLWTLSLQSNVSFSYHHTRLRVAQIDTLFSKDVIQRYSRACALSRGTPPTPSRASSSPCATTPRPNPARATSSPPSGTRSTASSTQRHRSSTSS